jgi:hypothetical protein
MKLLLSLATTGTLLLTMLCAAGHCFAGWLASFAAFLLCLLIHAFAASIDRWLHPGPVHVQHWPATKNGDRK